MRLSKWEARIPRHDATAWEAVSLLSDRLFAYSGLHTWHLEAQRKSNAVPALPMFPGLTLDQQERVVTEGLKFLYVNSVNELRQWKLSTHVVCVEPHERCNPKQ